MRSILSLLGAVFVALPPLASPAVAADGEVRIGAKELRTAVQAYSAAFLTGRERAAWRALTPHCRTLIGRAPFAAGDLYGFLPIRNYRAVISGGSARVTYTYAVRRLNQSREPWRVVNGAWRNNDC